MLRYSNTIDDLVAFNLYHIENSPAMRKQMNNSRIRVALISMALLYILAHQMGDMTLFYIGIAITAVYFLLKPFLSKRGVRGTVKFHMKNGLYNNVACEHRIYIDKNFLMEETEFEKTGHRIDRILRLAHTDDRCFIYVDEHRAHIIPKDHMTEGNVEEFLRHLESLMKKAD